MRLTALGSAGGCPGRAIGSSGYLVQHEDTTIWLDAGTGTFLELGKHIDPGSLTAVVLSHIHVDHCTDIFGLYGYLAYGPSGVVPVPVYVASEMADHLAAFARASSEHVFHHVLEMREVGDGDAVRVGSLRLRFAETSHPVPTIATRLEVDGTVMAYSGDTGPGGGFPGLASGADLVLCEATIAGERNNQSYPYHLTGAEAGALARDAGAGRLVVTHIPPQLDTELIRSEAEEQFGSEVALAAPGTVFDI